MKLAVDAKSQNATRWRLAGDFRTFVKWWQGPKIGPNDETAVLPGWTRDFGLFQQAFVESLLWGPFHDHFEVFVLESGHNDDLGQLLPRGTVSLR